MSITAYWEYRRKYERRKLIYKGAAVLASIGLGVLGWKAILWLTIQILK